jgi:5-methylcytosine-specific restriction endonuclease McrA
MSEGSRRSRPLPPGWTATRLRILARDGYTCPCGAPATDVDHVVGAAEGGSEEDANLRALCRACHLAKTQKSAGQRGGLVTGKIRREIAARKYRQPEHHPGLKRPEGQ